MGLLLSAAMVGTTLAVTTVTTTADSGAGSLRAAIANYPVDPNINFNIPANSAGCVGTVCTIALASTLNLSVFSGTTVSINGIGNNTIIINGNGNRVLNITAGGTNFSLNGLTITGGGNASQGAGIIFTAQNLTLSNSTISNNTATTANSQGGGLYAIGGTSVTISNSTFSGNNANGGSTTAGGGGIYFIGNNLNILNSTFSANNSNGGKGGAIYIANNTTGELVNDTFTLNTTSATAGRGGAIYKENGTLALRNTIVGNNTTGGQGPDIFFLNSAPTSRGNNLIGNTNGSGLTAAAGDQFNVPPQLAALANTGGPTQTHALNGGVAIDGGNNCVVTNTCNPALPFALTTDQRGFARLIGTNVDIGAFEVQGSTAATTTVNGQVILPNDLGLTNALVTITNSQGVSQTTLTGKRGSFQFRGVLAGETYILTVSARRYAFAPQVISPTENLSGLIFTALQ